MKRKLLFISILIMLFISVFTFKIDVKKAVNYLIVPDYSLLAEKGYTDQEIKVINSQESVEISKVIEQEYTKNIIKVITIPNYRVLFEKGYSDEEITQINLAEKKILEKVLISEKITEISRYLNESNYRVLYNKGYSEKEIHVFDGLSFNRCRDLTQT